MKKLALLGLLALTGCIPHLTQEQCLNMNWHQEGLNDGLVGKPLRDLTQAAIDCQKFNLNIQRDAYAAGWHQGMKRYCAPDFNTGMADGAQGVPSFAVTDRNPMCQQAGLTLKTSNYEAGRQKGLKSFCTYENGNQIGRQGQAKPPVCTDARFASGWQAGADFFCGQTQNAFVLGKDNQPYPDACAPNMYLAFKAEYDRGANVGTHLRELDGRLHQIDDEIDHFVRAGHLHRHDDMYELGEDRSPEARHALDQAYDRSHERQHVERELFELRNTN